MGRRAQALVIAIDLLTGGSPADSACDPRGETWDVRDLVVCDGSAFPTASGVNPMVSIEAIAHMNARGLAARLA